MKRATWKEEDRALTARAETAERGRVLVPAVEKEPKLSRSRRGSTTPMSIKRARNRRRDALRRAVV